METCSVISSLVRRLSRQEMSTVNGVLLISSHWDRETSGSSWVLKCCVIWFIISGMCKLFM